MKSNRSFLQEVRTATKRTDNSCCPTSSQARSFVEGDRWRASVEVASTCLGWRDATRPIRREKWHEWWNDVNKQPNTTRSLVTWHVPDGHGGVIYPSLTADTNTVEMNTLCNIYMWQRELCMLETNVRDVYTAEVREIGTTVQNVHMGKKKICSRL